MPSALPKMSIGTLACHLGRQVVRAAELLPVATDVPPLESVDAHYHRAASVMSTSPDDPSNDRSTDEAEAGPLRSGPRRPKRRGAAELLHPDDVPTVSIAALLDHDDAWVRGPAAALAGQQRERSFVAQLKSLEADGSQTMLNMTVAQIATMALDRIAGRRPLMVPFNAARLRTQGIDGEAPREKGFF